MMDWYSLFVITGEEENVAKWLGFFFPETTFAVLIPKRKLIERRNGKNKPILRKMFPGYVLVNIDINLHIYHILKKVPGLVRILNSGEEQYTKIPHEEIDCILRLLGEGDVVDCSKVDYEDSRAIVQSGPLKGMEDLIKKVDKRKKRAKISIPFMGVIKEIDVGIEVPE